jgi:hypothetical protein
LRSRSSAVVLLAFSSSYFRARTFTLLISFHATGFLSHFRFSFALPVFFRPHVSIYIHSHTHKYCTVHPHTHTVHPLGLRQSNRVRNHPDPRRQPKFSYVITFLTLSRTTQNFEVGVLEKN